MRGSGSWRLLVLLTACGALGAAEARGDTPACRSVQSCTRVCVAARNPADCFNIGLRYQKGLAGLPKSDTLAADFYRRACARNVAAGCTNYGYYMYWGKGGVTTDKPRGAALYRRGCDGGDHVGCNNLASAYAWGSGVPVDLAVAVRLFRQACAAGVQLACKNATDTEARRVAAARRPGLAEKRPESPPAAGGIREKGATPETPLVRPMPHRALPSPAAGAARLARECSARQPAACLELAVLYLTSWALPQKAAYAARLLGQACDGGQGEACARLAALVGEGKLVARDVPRSVELLHRGCAAQSGRACRALAALHRWGDSRPGGLAQRDAALGTRLLAQALGHYRRECDDADASACTGLATMVWYGEGTARDAARGRALLQRACDGGDLDGCERLGSIYANGERLTPVDRPRGVGLFRRACDGGLAAGCTRLANAYHNGAGVPKDRLKSRELLRRACPKDAYACWNLGKAWERGADGSRDEAKAEAAYRDGCDAGDASCCGALKRMKVETSSAARALKACDAGQAPQCLLYAEMLKSGRGVVQDAASALGFYLRACEGGIGAGCVGLGLLLKHGASGVTADAAGAAEAFQKAVPIFTTECRGRRPESCADLADLFCDGSMLPRDQRKVLQLLERGCGRRHLATCTKLGARLLRGGCGLKIKPEKAVAVIGKACEAGDEAACDALVYAYGDGAHLRKDPAQALRWMQKACDQGMGRFCLRLGTAHEWGEHGAPKDRARALLYYQRACGKGVSYACTKQKSLQEKLRQAPP